MFIALEVPCYECDRDQPVGLLYTGDDLELAKEAATKAAKLPIEDLDMKADAETVLLHQDCFGWSVQIIRVKQPASST